MSRGRARQKINAVRATVVLTVRQRCFYLFLALLLLLMSVPFLEYGERGRVVLNLINLSILIAGATAVGRGAGALTIGLLLAAPAALFQAAGYATDMPRLILLSNAFAAAFYFITVTYLLTYALRREVLTMDKLYGAAAAFLMVGVLWGYFYAILLYFYPVSLLIDGEPLGTAPPSTLLYFSFVTLTSTGMSDIMPVQPIARMLCAFEMITGVLFLAVLIARLASSYPGKEP